MSLFGDIYLPFQRPVFRGIKAFVPSPAESGQKMGSEKGQCCPANWGERGEKCYGSKNKPFHFSVCNMWMVEIRHEQASLSADTDVTRDAFYLPWKAADFSSSGHEAQPGIASNIAPRGLTKCIMKTFPQPQSCGKTLCCNGSHYKTPQYCQACLVSDQLDIGAGPAAGV